LKRKRRVFTTEGCRQLFKIIVRNELNIPARFSYLEWPFATAIFSSLAFAVKSSFKDLEEIITGVFFAAANFADEFSISIDSAANVAPNQHKFTYENKAPKISILLSPQNTTRYPLFVAKRFVGLQLELYRSKMLGKDRNQVIFSSTVRMEWSQQQEHNVINQSMSP